MGNVLTKQFTNFYIYSIFFYYIKAQGVDFSNPVNIIVRFEDNEFKASIAQNNQVIEHKPLIRVDGANFVKDTGQIKLSSPEETSGAWGISRLHLGSDLRLMPSPNSARNMMPVSGFQIGEVLRMHMALKGLARGQGDQLIVQVFYNFSANH